MVSGVPQGTVLGPILFLLYINDLLPTLKNCKGLCFADDTKLISKILGTESTARLQEDLCRVIDWSTMNNIELHEDKFQLLSYPLNSSHLLRQLPFYSENLQYKTPKGHVITMTDTARDLGILVSKSQVTGHGHLTSNRLPKVLEKWHHGFYVHSVIVLPQ